MVASVACVRYRIPMAVGPVDQPRASWSIRAGKPLNEHEVCRSDADRTCVIPASSPDEPVSVVVSVYLHPVGDAKTTYQGVFSADFMPAGRWGTYERPVDVTIEPGRRPTGISAAAIATATPGSYVFRMAVLGDVPSRKDPHQFEEMIPVEITSATSQASGL
jgi:hypothetical protein